MASLSRSRPRRKAQAAVVWLARFEENRASSVVSNVQRAARGVSLDESVVLLPHRHAVVPLTPSTRHAIDATRFEGPMNAQSVEREAHARRVVAQREEVPPVERLRQLLVRCVVEVVFVF